MSAAQRKTLRKHIIALACYRGTEDDALYEAYKEVFEPASRKILLAVFAVARLLAEAEYYRRNSALADSDAPEEFAKAQIQETRKNRDMVLDNMIASLQRVIPRDIEGPLDEFNASANIDSAVIAIEGLTQVAIDVSAIRELCDDQCNQLSPESGSTIDTQDKYV